MKRVFIVHGWSGYPEEGWFPWLKNELEQKSFSVSVPQMPDADEPDIEKWVKHLTSVVGKPDPNTFLVGHSIGCQTILRYLETLPSAEKIGGVILVAGFFTLTNMEKDELEIAEPWLETPIDYAKVLINTNNITAIFSDNDQYVPLENAALFETRLHPKIIIQKNQGHFSGSNGITELPVVIDELESWTA
ncbi:MAG TPA: alpha/beta fold hydrolase [Candidatus Peribacteraceae bacterium]|nr:alpha/beta fold hydrolase [Candidatus Peribacteraceae bacterium]